MYHAERKPLTFSVPAAKLSLTIMLLELLMILMTMSVNHHARKKMKLGAAAVDFWASWDMNHEHNEEWQSEASSQPSHVETALDKFLAKLCFLRKSNPSL